MTEEYEDLACKHCGVEQASSDSTGPCTGNNDGNHEWVPIEGPGEEDGPWAPGWAERCGHGTCTNCQQTLDGLKVKNSTPKDPLCAPMWDEEGNACINYVGCGKPCEKPCVLCLVWTGYGVLGVEDTNHG